MIRPRTIAISLTLTAAITSLTFSQPATKPTAAPSTKPAAADRVNANATLDRLLRSGTPTPKPLQPLPEGPVMDSTSAKGALSPKAPAVKLIREGTYVVDRVGRLRTSDDGQKSELVFDSDGDAMQDPPMLILPNLALMQMENASQNNRDRKFRVTGMVTEYRGRNCILMDKAVPVADVK